MKDLKYDEVDYPEVLKPLILGDADYLHVTYFNRFTSSFCWQCKRRFRLPDEYHQEYLLMTNRIQEISDFSKAVLSIDEHCQSMKLNSEMRRPGGVLEK